MVPAAQDSHSGDSATAGSLADLLAREDEQFVLCAYRTFLGRDPDPEGLGNYLEQLRSGASKLQLLTDLRLSPEGLARAVNIPGLLDAVAVPLSDDVGSRQSGVNTLAQLLALQDGKFVRAAYEMLLGREPDPAGFAYYLDQLRAGASKAGLLALFRACAEGKEREKNLRTWAAAYLQSARPQGPETAPDSPDAASLAGPECAAPPLVRLLRMANAPFVATVFRNLIGRMPDTRADAFYVNRLAGGVSKIDVLAEISESEEGKAARTFQRDVDSAIRRHKWGMTPVLGRLVRFVIDTESEHESERRLRRIENQLYLLNRELAQDGTGKAGPGRASSSRYSLPAGEPATPVAMNEMEHEQTDEHEDERHAIAKPVRRASATLRTLPVKSDRKNEN